MTVALLAWAIRSFVVTPFSIPSVSMLPTLYVGDYLMTAKWPFGYSRFSFPFGFPSFEGRILGRLPERGDVVVFRPEGSDIEFVKRVIGLPGDTVAMSDGRLWINGKPVQRERLAKIAVPISANSPCKTASGAVPDLRSLGGQPICMYPAYRETLPNGRSYTVLDQVNMDRDDFPSTGVPNGYLFLMGDNRDDSLDSRFAPIDGGIGFVPVERLVGRALLTFWSTDGSAVYWKPWTWFSSLRANRLGNGYGDSR